MQKSSFHMESPVFRSGGNIPEDFTGHGKDISPPLKWGNVPPGTQELALICEDPDAPRNPPWVHWVIYNMPANRVELPAGISNEPLDELDFEQGENSAGEIGYSGPLPPPETGIHHYYFRLYALNEKLKLPPGLSKYEVMNAIEDHIIGEATVVGTHQHH